MFSQSCCISTPCMAIPPIPPIPQIPSTSNVPNMSTSKNLLDGISYDSSSLSCTSHKPSNIIIECKPKLNPNVLKIIIYGSCLVFISLYFILSYYAKKPKNNINQTIKFRILDEEYDMRNIVKDQVFVKNEKERKLAQRQEESIVEINDEIYFKQYDLQSNPSIPIGRKSNGHIVTIVYDNRVIDVLNTSVVHTIYDILYESSIRKNDMRVQKVYLNGFTCLIKDKHKTLLQHGIPDNRQVTLFLQ